MSLKSWKPAGRPNYTTNVDLKYPYSELPYLAQYKLIKIPSTGLIEHVDYWGEGRITIKEGSTGFRACYNVNRQYQQVSNGPDKYKKIPNRIPVRDEDECDTRAYIKDDSVKLVTLMGSPINPNSAKDITRMINKHEGMVVIYSKDVKDAEVKILISELKNKLIIHSPEYDLTDYLKEPTLVDSPLVFLNEEATKDIFFKYVSSGDNHRAIHAVESLKETGAEFMIKEVVDRLVRSRETNVFGFAYRLWNDANQKDVVENHFPDAIKIITKQEKVKVIGKYWNEALKLDANLVGNERLTWGDKNDQSSNRVSWKFVPVWEMNTLLFKIQNMEHSMYLHLNVNTDESGDKSVLGSLEADEKRHMWKLIPISKQDGLVFLIENHEYGQCMKLDANADSYGDRQAWGNSDKVGNNTEYFEFIIKSWE